MRAILNSHSVTTLKKEISKTNIKGYSKMKKAEIVTLMMKHQDRFRHIKLNEKKSAPKKTEPRKKIVMTSFPKPKAKKEKKDLGTYQLEEAQVKGSQIMFYKLPNGKITSARETAKEVWKKEGYSKILLPKKKKKLVIIKKPEPPKPKPQKKKKKLVIKPKVKKEIIELPELKAITGLTKKEANKLDPAELFGLLPKELAQIVLNPKETGQKVGNLIKIKDFTIEDYESEYPDTYNDNMDQAFSQMGYYNDYTEVFGFKVLTPSQNRYYNKNISDYRSGEYDEKMEELEEKMRDKVSNILFTLDKKEMKEFKKDNKGRIDTIKNFAKEFHEKYNE